MDQNVIMPLLGLGVIAGLIYNYSNTPEIKENFLAGLPPVRPVVMKEAASKSTNQLYTIPGTYQAALAPRFSNLDYGANILYNMPTADKLAVPPVNPISYGSMGRSCNCANSNVEEGYCSSCGVVGGCRQNSTGMDNNSINMNNAVPSNFTVSNYAQQMAQNSFTPTTDILPAQNMGQQNMMVNALGQADVQPVVYDRYIYANQKSRLYAQQDFFRGNIPIIPEPTGWFRPSVRPQIDLNSGALAVMGGVGNQTNQELLALQNAAAGGALDVGSGINFAVQRSNYLGSAGGDIQVTAFP